MGTWEQRTRVGLPSAGDWTQLATGESALIQGLLNKQWSGKELAKKLEREDDDSVTVSMRRAVNFLALRAGVKSPAEFLDVVDEVARRTPGHQLTLEAVVLALRSRSSEVAQASQTTTPAVEDDEEHADLKPDPGTLRSMTDLRHGLRAYWEWAGSLGARRVADNSNNAFKRSTALKLIAADPTVPLKLAYVTGMIAGCGGSASDQSRWASAYRRIRRANRDRHLQAAI
jgi:hypothetical protein